MKVKWQYLAALMLIVGFGAFILNGATAAAATRSDPGGMTYSVSEPVSAVLSPPLRDMEIPAFQPELAREANPIQWLGEGVGVSGKNIGMDPLVALGENNGESPLPLVTFEGVPSISSVTPPDTNGDVGPNHYIQMTNFHFQIWDKGDVQNGIPPTSLFGPIAVGTFFAPLGGGCESNSGDPIVLYDDMADRWVLTQFDLSGTLGMCFAVSQTADPLGAYWMYNISTPDFPDYPKIGVWPDGYYMSTNTGFPNQYYVHVFDRVAMLAGAPATRQSVGNLANLMMPADVDGPTAPPAGEPGILYTFYHPSATGHPPGPERLAIYEYDVDWVTPANSTFTLVQELPIAAFNYTICGFFAGGCIQQPGTAQLLDDLSWWPMFRFQYRNFGGYAAMVGNFTVDADGANHAGIRWFEIRKTGATYSLYQEGTHFPDTDSRWMGSAAMDQDGNIALAYSVSSTSTIPSIRYATRLAGDPLGTLSAEAEMWTGGGVQTGIQRWGDYSDLTVDPVDGCTFWFTTEYHDTNDSGFNWNTRIGVFKLDECGEPDFTLSANPTEQAICAASDALYTINVGQVQGYTDNVTLSASGNPAGTTAAFSTNPVTPPGTSTMTIGNTAGAIAGSYAIDVIGIAPTSTHTTTVGLDVFDVTPGAPSLTAPANGATGVNLVPTFQWSAPTQASTYDLEVATDPGFTNIVYSASGIEGTSHQATSALDPLTEYFWWVRASNVCGTGGWSSTFSFTTSDIPPILLVDDDDDNPDMQSVWTAALDALGLSYDVWVTGSSDVEPDGAAIAPYDVVLWFSGDRFGTQNSGPAGPSASTEAALGTWLDGGGCFFISSQDYVWDKGVTAFMTSRLGVSTVTNDNGDYTSVTGQNVFAGLGPYALTFPYTDFTDPITVGNGGVQAMLGNNGNVAGTSKDGGTYKTSYWAFGLEALPVGGQQAALQTMIDWCGLQTELPDIDVSPTSLSSTQSPGVVTNQDLTISNTGAANLNWTIDEDVAAAPLAGWSDNFDSYATGADLHGMGGWKGWSNDPGATAFTSDAQSISTPNSVDINGGSDLVHEYSGYDSGTWVYTAWQYIPGSYTGQTYFILLNQYDDAGATNNWSTQVCFNSSTGLLYDDTAAGCTGASSLAIVFDQWVEIRVEIDLDADTQSFYYDNQLLYSDTWSGHVSGGGITSVGAVDLFANAATAVYYDDMSLEQASAPTCAAPQDVPWLSVSPDNGTTGASGSSIATVSIDSTGLTPGNYGANLCVNSNDPDESLVIVPVDLEVSSTVPDIDVSPGSLSSTQSANSIVNQTLTIANTGTGTLNWSIDEDNSPTAAPVFVHPFLDENAGVREGADWSAAGTGTGVSVTAESTLNPASQTITQSVDPSTITSLNSVSCNAGGIHTDNSYLRAFDLDSFGLTTGFNVTEVEIGIETAASGSGTGQPMTVNLYEWDGVSAFTFANLIPGLVGTATVNVPDQALSLFTIPVAGSVAGGQYLVVEIFTPDGTAGNNSLFIGSNAAGQTGPSYLAAVDCGVAEPTNTAAIGFPGMHIVMSVTGDAAGDVSCDAPEDIPWLSVSPTSGSTGASGSTDVTVTYDSTGLTPGDYTAALCVSSNDPDESLVVVNVDLTVQTGYTIYLPIAVREP